MCVYVCVRLCALVHVCLLPRLVLISSCSRLAPPSPLVESLRQSIYMNLQRFLIKAVNSSEVTHRVHSNCTLLRCNEIRSLKHC